MTDKAYIVANKEQELDVLKKFEQKGLVWLSGDNPTEWIKSDSDHFHEFIRFPYVLIESENISWLLMTQLTDETIVYDGRKEGEMDKKYKVTQKFMDELKQWRDVNNLDALKGDWRNAFRPADFTFLPDIISRWHFEDLNPIERNNRLIAIIQWLNGEDMFELDKPHKFVVRSDKSDNDGDYIYVQVKNGTAVRYRYYASGATRFDTREEAQEWANAHQVIVEIDEAGNEVE